MGEAKRRKRLDSNYGKDRDHVERWLNSVNIEPILVAMKKEFGCVQAERFMRIWENNRAAATIIFMEITEIDKTLLEAKAVLGKLPKAEAGVCLTFLEESIKHFLSKHLNDMPLEEKGDE